MVPPRPKFTKKRGVPPNGQGKKQNPLKPADTKGREGFILDVRCAIGVPR